MMFYRKIAIWDADKYTTRDTTQLIHEKDLVFETADVLKDGIGCRHIKAVIGERQARIWLNTDVTYVGESRFKIDAITESASRDFFWMRVSLL